MEADSAGDKRRFETMSNKRENLGIDIVEQGFIEKKSDKNYQVRSKKSSNSNYSVQWKNKEWKCNCPDYQKNNKKCKHIFAVIYYLRLDNIRTNIRIVKEDVCPICKENDLVKKDGKRYNRSGTVQRYYCKRCREGFSGHPGFKHMKHKAETIVTALDLYYRGLSLRQIAEHLESIQKTKISHTTVQNWIRKYISLIDLNIDEKIPDLSSRWHADETLISVSGRHLRLWALLDADTRFLIASHLSKKQSINDACTLFKKAKKKTKNCPNEIVTDGLSAYPEAIKMEMIPFSKEPIIHLHGSLTKAYNNKMERAMGIIKNRTKPMLGLYDDYSADLFSKGFTIYYNYVRNHISLNEQTPAMAAGITDHKMNWFELIDQSVGVGNKK